MLKKRDSRADIGVGAMSFKESRRKIWELNMRKDQCFALKCAGRG